MARGNSVVRHGSRRSCRRLLVCVLQYRAGRLSPRGRVRTTARNSYGRHRDHVGHSTHGGCRQPAGYRQKPAKVPQRRVQLAVDPGCERELGRSPGWWQRFRVANRSGQGTRVCRQHAGSDLVGTTRKWGPAWNGCPAHHGSLRVARPVATARRNTVPGRCRLRRDYAGRAYRAAGESRTSDGRRRTHRVWRETHIRRTRFGEKRTFTLRGPEN